MYEQPEMTESRANWAVRKIASLRQEIAYLEYRHSAIINRLKRDLSELEARVQTPLSEWAKTRLGTGKSKYVDLLFGRLQFRTNPSRMILDQSLDTKWFEENYPAYVRAEVRLVLDKRGLETLAMNHLKETGELLPGFSMLPETEGFYINTKSDEARHEEIFLESDSDAYN